MDDVFMYPYTRAEIKNETVNYILRNNDSLEKLNEGNTMAIPSFTGAT